ncbi:N-acetylmuramoyl-L-alanine amidase [Paraliobacillus sp. JSM ZJ581]|uniref:N-acetylmuramoyl-L-alanine amidase n=1 Tax=Paraliobacillus sp. JSM ZJ581 TaxID=3342118 RepID=UPI0035A99049
MHQSLKWATVFILFAIILSFSTITYAADVIIQVNDLQVRNGPGLGYDVIGEVNQGESYSLMDEQQHWVKIKYIDRSGWVAKEYIEIDKQNQMNIDEDKEPSSDEGTIKLDQKKINPQSISTLKQKVIVLDAGHGGRDIGATGVSDTYEKEYTLNTALNIKSYLEQLGAIVHLTRSSDRFISLTPRASYANHLKADAFLSIHYNSTPQYPSASGIGTYYYDDKDKTFAKFVHEELIKTTKSNDRNVQFGDFQVLRTNHTPGLLLELGFISNTSEEERVQTNIYQKKISRGIIAGLQRYFSNAINK